MAFWRPAVPLSPPQILKLRRGMVGAPRAVLPLKRHAPIRNWRVMKFRGDESRERHRMGPRRLPVSVGDMRNASYDAISRGGVPFSGLGLVRGDFPNGDPPVPSVAPFSRRALRAMRVMIPSLRPCIRPALGWRPRAISVWLAPRASWDPLFLWTLLLRLC